MAYETGVASSQEDFLTKLSTFAQANGWTQDELDVPNKELAIRRNNVFISFRWDAVATTGGIAIFQALGFTMGNTPGNHPNDSGSGLISGTPISSQRRLDRIGNGPFTAYHFFAGSVFLHVALEYAPGLYRHCSFGELVKNGTWTGGEYCAGHTWAGDPDSPANPSHCVLVDWRSQLSNLEGATVHVEGMPGEGGTSKWGVVIDSTTVGNDRAGIARVTCLGGLRDGFLFNALHFIRSNPGNGFVSMAPLQVYYRRLLSPEQWFKLGTIPGMRGINIHFINPAEAFTIGADTWRCFPYVRKQFLQLNTDESGNWGIAYRQA